MQPRPAYEIISGLCTKNDAILDVESGNGYLLNIMKEVGYTNLTGGDLYLNASKVDDDILLIKGDLTSVIGKEKYDLIMFHHSLEHMSNQFGIFRGIKALLRVPILLV